MLHRCFIRCHVARVHLQPATPLHTVVSKAIRGGGHLSGSDGVEGVGEHQERMPEGGDAVPCRRHPVRPILQDHWLHRRPRQESPCLERQHVLAIRGGSLQTHRGLSATHLVLMMQVPWMGGIACAAVPLLYILAANQSCWRCFFLLAHQGGRAHFREEQEGPSDGVQLPSSCPLNSVLHLPRHTLRSPWERHACVATRQPVSCQVTGLIEVRAERMLTETAPFLKSRSTYMHCRCLLHHRDH